MSDAKPRETAILERGEYLKPTEKVTFATPAFLPPLPKDAPRGPTRVGPLADVAPSNRSPPACRSIASGSTSSAPGIVKTSEDFGVQSEYPIHGALLDWLAVEFRERGWSMKAMQSARSSPVPPIASRAR